MPAVISQSLPVPTSKTFSHALVCPDCRSALSPADTAFHCATCGAKFPVELGVPKLWPPSRTKEIEASVASFRGSNREARESPFLRALMPPNPICDPGEASRHERVKNSMNTGLVVNLGAKTARWGEHVVNLDLVMPQNDGAGGNSTSSVDILGDIQRLPFADASVDGVICTYVLEHVADSRACIDEIARVVKPGGQIFISVPFIFPTHPDPLDRWRWTLDGLRYSLRDFDEIEAGNAGGPFSTYVAITPTMLGSAFSNFYLFNAVRFTLGWLMWPFKFVDIVAANSKKAYMTAPNFFFWGRKR